MRWILVGAAALALAACGGSSNKSSGSSGSSSSSSGGGATSTLSLSAPANGSLKFDQSSLTSKAGKVTIKFDNKSSSVPHGVTITGNGVNSASSVVTGSSTSVTVDLKPGKYTYFCPVDGHRDQGMEGTLTVS
jgi:plastocyanin